LSSAPSERWRPSQAFLDGTVNLAPADQRKTEAMSPHSYFGIEAATVERIAEWIGATTGR